jgi:methionyl-tRNA formyltransferase
MKIGYFADGVWAHNAFKKLVDDRNIEIAFICVRNDHRDPVLCELGKKYGIDVLWTENINSDEFIKKMKAYDVELFVSMSFNQIFKTDMINLPPLKTINCHAGKLPFYRGRNILNWALINDEKEFGITVHYVDEGIDTGDIILQRTFKITDEDDYGTLLERAHTECAGVLYEAIKQIRNGTATRTAQSTIDPVGMYCGARKEGDELLDWNQTSRDVFNFVRAVSKPAPQATCFVDGKKILINHVRMIENAPVYKGIPGQILGKTSDGWITKTQDSIVEITEYTSEKKLRVGDRMKME